MAEKFKFHLTENGKLLITQTETTANGKDLPLRTIMVNSQLVEKVLDTLVHFRNIINDCFASDQLFDRQLQISFQDFCNLDVGKFSMSELLACYVDKILRKGGIKGEKKQLEEQLENAALLFSFMQDKDLFLYVFRN